MAIPKNPIPPKSIIEIPLKSGEFAYGLVTHGGRYGLLMLVFPLRIWNSVPTPEEFERAFSSCQVYQVMTHSNGFISSNWTVKGALDAVPADYAEKPVLANLTHQHFYELEDTLHKYKSISTTYPTNRKLIFNGVAGHIFIENFLDKNCRTGEIPRTFDARYPVYERLSKPE